MFKAAFVWPMVFAIELLIVLMAYDIYAKSDGNISAATMGGPSYAMSEDSGTATQQYDRVSVQKFRNAEGVIQVRQ